MPTENDIEEFIGQSFSSIWDLELLSVILEHSEAMTSAELVDRMRGSELVVQQGIASLVAAGIASVDADGRFQFCPVNDGLARSAREASDFYQRFPGRARRLMISKQAPGLSAFADAFRLRKG